MYSIYINLINVMQEKEVQIEFHSNGAQDYQLLEV